MYIGFSKQKDKILSISFPKKWIIKLKTLFFLAFRNTHETECYNRNYLTLSSVKENNMLSLLITRYYE